MMSKTGRITVFFMALTLVAAVACKKEAPTTTDTSSVVTEESVAALAGTPAQNMITVFELGLNAVKSGNASAAAAAINKAMSNYNVADLRAKAKEAKDAGQGATADEVARFKALQEEYAAEALKLGGSDANFLNAHKEWSKAWGLK